MLQPLTTRYRLALGAGFTLGVALVIEMIWTTVSATASADPGQVKQLIDLAVFKDAGAAWLQGTPYYGEEFHPRSGYAFIYPPFAAMIFSPLATVPDTLLNPAWQLLCVGLSMWIVAVALRRLGHPRPWMLTAGLLGILVLLQTTVDNVFYGQINLVLYALVVADVLGVLPRPLRGVGIGIAAGIKITPAAFALVFLVRRDWWSVVRAAGTFVATVLVALPWSWEASRWFWTTGFFDTNRAGDHTFNRNQALTGILSRLPLLRESETAESAVWALCALVGVVLTWWAARVLTRAEHLGYLPSDAAGHGTDVAVLALVATSIAVFSPYSVVHHFSLVPLLVLALTLTPAFREWRWAIVALLLSLAAPVTELLVDTTTIDAGRRPYVLSVLGAWAAGNALTLSALALLAAMLRTAWRYRAARQSA